MLEAERMNDISTFLKDLGFQVTPYDPPLLDEAKRHRIYVMAGWEREGSDEMVIGILADGRFTQTERETIIPGGKTFKTNVDSGNMTLDMRAEMSGNVKKLTETLNTIHTSLKERFRHVSTLE